MRALVTAIDMTRAGDRAGGGRMVKRALLLDLLVALSLLLAPGGASHAQDAAVSPELETTTVAQLSPDVSAVISAVVTRMRGTTRPGDALAVEFAGNLASTLREPGFAYHGFVVGAVGIHQYEVSGADENERFLAGTLLFSDLVGRRTDIGFSVGYTVARDRITVTLADVVPVYRRIPGLIVAFVPGAVVSDFLIKKITSSTELLSFALENAVPLVRPAEFPKGRRDYYVFAFFLDRLAPGDRVDLRLSESAEGLSGKSRDVHVVNDQGWRVAMVQSRFTLGGETATFVKAIHLPAGGSEPRLAGVFSTGRALQPE